MVNRVSIPTDVPEHMFSIKMAIHPLHKTAGISAVTGNEPDVAICKTYSITDVNPVKINIFTRYIKAVFIPRLFIYCLNTLFSLSKNVAHDIDISNMISPIPEQRYDSAMESLPVGYAVVL